MEQQVLKPKDIKKLIESRFILIPKGIAYHEAERILERHFKHQL